MVPAHQSSRTLPAVLAALTAQSYPEHLVEVVVVDDGSDPPVTLPELGTNSWQVFPDGTMETTYQLRPNLTWHDGAPLTAEDFVLAWQVYLHPALGNFETKPENLMESVVAADPRDLVRGEDGQIRGFHNTCSHRGNRVIWAEDGHGKDRRD